MAITLCTVSGTILAPDTAALLTAVVRASLTNPGIHTADGTFIADSYIEASVDSNGAWTLDLVETTTISKKMLFEIRFPNNVGISSKFYLATIPNAASANFDDIAEEI